MMTAVIEGKKLPCYQDRPLLKKIPDEAVHTHTHTRTAHTLVGGLQARSWPGGSGGPDPPCTCQGHFSESCKSVEFL